MAKKEKGRDFYGQEVTALIGEACKEFGVSQEELDIEVLETGSAGIFGLCRKKAHIRVRLKKQKVEEPLSTSQSGRATKNAVVKETTTDGDRDTATRSSIPDDSDTIESQQDGDTKTCSAGKKRGSSTKNGAGKKKSEKGERKRVQDPVQPPSEDVLARVRGDICELLELMGYPSEVTLQVDDTALRCHIQGEHEKAVVGTEGRTLDSMQYLLRKMMAGVLPDRMMLSLDAGDFRRRRAQELKERALALAQEVRETGKTQAIPALNPAERREVHMILQEDKTIRSRSVGEGLFKKVLIYKPGSKSGRPPRKRKRRSSGRSKEN